MIRHRLARYAIKRAIEHNFYAAYHFMHWRHGTLGWTWGNIHFQYADFLYRLSMALATDEELDAAEEEQ